MTQRTSAIERLEELLDAKDERLAELEQENRNLRAQHENELNGLLDHDAIPDDESLPVPRLEIVQIPDEERGWKDMKTIYRIVYKHLLGQVVSVPLGVTRTSCGLEDKPPVGELPYRDGCHAHHDAALFGWPLFQIVGDGPPVRVTVDDGYEHQHKLGREHRRG